LIAAFTNAWVIFTAIKELNGSIASTQMPMSHPALRRKSNIWRYAQIALFFELIRRSQESIGGSTRNNGLQTCQASSCTNDNEHVVVTQLRCWWLHRTPVVVLTLLDMAWILVRG